MLIKRWIKIPGLLGIVIPLLLIACVEQPSVPKETWKYNKFIQEVKKGTIEKVSISADKSKAIVTVKQDPNQKQVTLSDDPNLINLLTQNQVDIAVLPQR
jgi:cell division protease FtsH